MGRGSLGVGRGGQCSIFIGFSNRDGRTVASVVHRPIGSTYTAGAALEGFLKTKLNMATDNNGKRFLTSNVGISPFIQNICTELSFERVCFGGTGKMMMTML